MDYESERIQKRLFLKSEIIDKEFDPADFISFCDDIREGGKNFLNYIYNRGITY